MPIGIFGFGKKNRCLLQSQKLAGGGVKGRDAGTHFQNSPNSHLKVLKKKYIRSPRRDLSIRAED